MTSKLKKTKSVIAISLMLCALMPVLVFPANAETDKWTTVEAMPTPRSSFGAAVVDGKVYAIGGHNGNFLAVNEMYDPTTDTWITKKAMPTPRHCFGIAVYQNKIYVIGGVFNSSTPFSSGYTGLTEVYDPTTDTWETKVSMPTPRADLDANVVGDKIYLIDGTKYVDVFPFNTAANVNEVYDPTNDSWTTRTSIPRGCFGYASTTVGNKIYVTGGWVYQTHNLNQIYDTEADTWSYGKNLTSGAFTSSAGITSGILAPERIYVIGTQNQPNIAANYTQVYDIQNDTWTFATPMPTARYGLEVAVVNDELYAIGGRKNLNEFLDVNEKYCPIGYIPEFSSWIVLPLLFATTVVALLCRRKLTIMFED